MKFCRISQSTKWLMNIPQVNVLAYRKIFRRGVKTVDERCIARLTFWVILLSFPSPLFRSLTSSWRAWFLVCLHRSRPWAFFLLFSPCQICRCSVKSKATFYIYLAECLLIAQASEFFFPSMPHCRHCDREFVDDHALQQVAPIDLHVICLR